MTKMTVKEFLACAVPMDEARKKELGWSPKRYVPMFVCGDGIVCPVKDTMACSPGTFAGLENAGSILTLKSEVLKKGGS